VVDPNEWSLVFGLALVRRRDGYRVEQQPRLVSDQSGLHCAVPMTLMNVDEPGRIEQFVRDRVETVFSTAEQLERDGQRLRSGPESISVVTLGHGHSVVSLRLRDIWSD